MDSLRLIIILSKPLLLLGGVLTYALGVGIAFYLGVRIDWSIYLLGQAWVTMLQISGHFLLEYYKNPLEEINGSVKPANRGTTGRRGGYLPQRSLKIAAFACLSVVAALSVIMISKLRLVPEAYVIMGLCFLGAFFYSTPPLRLETTGYGELIVSVLLGFMVPTLSFCLQAREFHPLVAISTFPLVALCLAMFISMEFPGYTADLWQSKRTLLVRTGWQSGMTLHNLLILTAFLLLLLASILGLPRFVLFPALMTLPLGLLELWQMWRIGNGARPNWKALSINSVALFGSMAYMITYAYWSH